MPVNAEFQSDIARRFDDKTVDFLQLFEGIVDALCQFSHGVLNRFVDAPLGLGQIDKPIGDVLPRGKRRRQDKRRHLGYPRHAVFLNEARRRFLLVTRHDEIAFFFRITDKTRISFRIAQIKPNWERLWRNNRVF